MDKRKETDFRRVGIIAAGLAFLASFAFFLSAYPYHLMRREQLNLFVFDWDYIIQRFRGIGWFSRLTGSFLEQFFCVRVLGALIIALLLTAIAVVVYRICRKFLGKRASIIVAATVFLWSFLRECGNLYLTRYTVATLCFFSLILLALQFDKVRDRMLAGALLLCAGAWALGAPCDSDYGRLWSVPRMTAERLFGQDAEVSRGNWDRVLKLSKKDLRVTESSACYNLALAMTGQMGEKLLDHSQGDYNQFLLSVSGDSNIFTNCIAGEQWYWLGDMTVAEQAAVTALQASPEHTGSRFIERLARVNTITGQDATAQKYLNILSKTIFYGRWAKRMLKGDLTEEDELWLSRARSNVAVSDIIHTAGDPHTVLQTLLEANPDNTPAREYLLCYDLLRYDLDQFIKDYDACRLNSRIYKEAVVLWVGREGSIPRQAFEEYGLDDKIRERMNAFSYYPNNYRNTYWYYYLKAVSQ